MMMASRRVGAPGSIAICTARLAGDAPQEYVGLGAVVAEARIGVSNWLAEATFLWANQPFVVFSVPELAAYSWIGRQLEQRGRFLWLASVERSFPRAHLTPGLSAGVELPAAVRYPLYATLVGGSPSLVGDRLMVFRETGEVSDLSNSKSPQPILHSRVQLCLDLGPLSVLAWFAYARDPNVQRTEITPLLTKVAIPERRNQYGAGVALAVSSN